MKKLAIQEDKIKRAIRDILVIDPLISITKMQDALLEKGHKTATGNTLDWRYIQKLKLKVHRKTVEDTDRGKVVPRIAEMKERYRLMIDKLLRIIFAGDDLKSMPASYKDQINAINSLVKLDVLIFNAELDAGIFERHLGTIEIEKRNKPLPPELKAVMLKAFVNWGIVPPEAITHEEPSITIKPTEARMVEQ
jgi:hypothetical protein